VANLQLPIATFAETAGTFVNCEGRWQSFMGVATPVGEARPGWKVLRVLGNLLGIKDFEYLCAADVCDELKLLLGKIKPNNTYHRKTALIKPNGEDAPVNDIDIPIYEVDGIVRRAAALQLTLEAQSSRGASS